MNWNYLTMNVVVRILPINDVLCWKSSFHHKKLCTVRYRSNLFLYLYSEAVSSYISGEKLINLRSRNPKVVHVRRMNSAMCLLVAALSLLPDTTEQQIHLAEKFWTIRYGEDNFMIALASVELCVDFYGLCLSKILTDPLYFGCFPPLNKNKSRIPIDLIRI